VTVASELRAHGHSEEATRVAEQALRWLDGLDTTLAGSVPMQMLRGEALTLLERWSDASAVLAKVAASAPSSIDARSEIGVIAARRGDAKAAQTMIDELARFNRPYVRGAHTLGRARIAAALGDRERTLDLLREAFAEGQPLAWPLHADHAFEALRGYGPFDELTAMNRGTK
jgi:tetratricopeptide (TPR) repeat protein